MKKFKSDRIPDELDPLIYDFYFFQRKAGIGWHDIATAFNDIYKTSYAESSLRNRFQSFEPEVEENKPGKTVEINEDGSVKIFDIMALTSDKQKTPEYVMESQGFPPTEWTMTKFTMGEWGKQELPLFSVRIELKPKDKSKLTIDDIKKVNENYKYIHKPVIIPYKDHNDNRGKGLEVALPDIHVGSDSANVELIKERITEIEEFALQTNVEKIYLTFLGDILHVDNTNETTIKGTQLKTEGTAIDMYLEAKDLLNYIVAELAEFQLEVFWVAGNHSEALEFALFDSLKDTWEDHEHIKFSVGKELRKRFLYGNTLVGLTHGHMPKKNLFGWLASDFPDDWGKAKYRELHYGHSHMEKVDEVGGVTNRMITTTSSADDYEYRMGYLEGRTVIQCFVYDKVRGLSQIRYF